MRQFSEVHKHWPTAIDGRPATCAPALGLVSHPPTKARYPLGDPRRSAHTGARSGATMRLAASRFA
jgi:hypothetical protein